MTTNVEIATVKNVFEENDVLMLKKNLSMGNQPLTAATFFVKGTVRTSVSFVLEYLYKKMVSNLDGFEAWLVLGNTARQPDTRIVRHRGLWGALKSRGLEVRGGSKAYEKAYEESGGIKFFGAQRLSTFSIASVSELLFQERCAYILLIPGGFAVQGMMDKKFCGELDDDLSGFMEVLQVGGLLKKIGEFDDRESGFVMLATSEVLLKMVS
ncbi:hypothetical protein [Pseudomonas abietaniphila]|uniref:Uncharacterized protein n=1 Tax=Pseudomonas abietaniphila TaxID=89065 RepID=A0A1G8PIK2_9PSED|nr:hypothetical protein [Pseudomonas abietaniphila]SDI92085.1 hypothetical protein SAMN05216605_1193 [Pseudomonas abietaniphila]